MTYIFEDYNWRLYYKSFLAGCHMLFSKDLFIMTEVAPLVNKIFLLIDFFHIKLS